MIHCFKLHNLCVILISVLFLLWQVCPAAANTFPDLRVQAKKGDVSAQFNLGWFYHEGVGTGVDNAEASRWFRKAAQQGSPEAAYYLGNLYAYGQGVKTNEAEAQKWYLMAANEGNAAAQEMLSSMYANGWGSKKNDIEAYFWCLVAAKKTPDTTATQACDADKTSLKPEQIDAALKRVLEWRPCQLPTPHGNAQHRKYFSR